MTKARAATQSDIARAAGVSRSLVSLALSGSPRVAADTRRRIREAAASLGYRVNVSASSLARRSSTIIGLVLPNLRNAFFEQVAACLGRAAARRGLTLFVTVGSDQPEVLHRAIESLLGVRVAGIVLVSPWLPREDLLAIGEEAPACVIGRRSPGGRVDSVRVDEVAAARLVVEHLAALSMRTICYIGPRMTDEASRHDRERALARAAGEAGTDGALVSYDNTYLALREEFSLTSVDQPEDLLGERAVDLVCRRAGLAPDDGPAAGAGARSAVLEPELIVRASSLGRQRPPHPAGSRPG